MITNIIFDLILLAILVIGAIIGIKNGFVYTVAKPIKFFAAIMLAFALAGFVGKCIVEPIIGPAITHKVSEILIDKYSEITASDAAAKLPTLIRLAAGLAGVDITEAAESAGASSVIEAIVVKVTSPLVTIIGRFLGFVIAYFVCKILLSLLLKIVNGIVNAGVVGKVNKTLGCIFTLFLAFIVCWMLTAISEFIFNIPVIASAGWVQRFTGGILYRFFRLFTPLDLLLSF